MFHVESVKVAQFGARECTSNIAYIPGLQVGAVDWEFGLNGEQQVLATL